MSRRTLYGVLGALLAAGVVVVLLQVIHDQSRPSGHQPTATATTTTQPRARASASTAPPTPHVSSTVPPQVTEQLVAFLEAYYSLKPGESLPQRTARIEALVPPALWPQLSFTTIGTPSGARMSASPLMKLMTVQVPRTPHELYVTLPMEATLVDANGDTSQFIYLTDSVWKEQTTHWTIIHFADALEGGS